MISNQIIQMVVQSIIEHQESIMGPLAFEQAKQVHGLKIGADNIISVEVNESENASLLTQLVLKFEELFGQTSVEVCRDAVRELHLDISPKELPQILQ